MLKPFLKASFVLLLMLAFAVGGARASGKMEAPLRQKVTLKTDSIGPNTVYKWVVQKGESIINTQVGTVFTYEFQEQGEHKVNLTVTGGDGSIRTTSVTVLVGDHFSRLKGDEGVDKTTFSLTTLPPLEDGRIHVIDNSPVLFHMAPDPDIIEYRIDQNIFADSDDNGIADDDIDNDGHPSYLRGGYFQAEYTPGASPKVAAEVTAVFRDGHKIEEQMEIIFDSAPPKDAEPFAVLNTIPAVNPADQVVYLYGDSAEVGYYVEKSSGAIVEYRIDRNIFEDSDGDGDAANDIDNLDHPSFSTGDVWKTVYPKTDNQIIGQVIVVTPDGKGSRIQRSFRFTDKPLAGEPEIIALLADKPFVLKGDPVLFTVSGLQLPLGEYVFTWDLDGDGEPDKQAEGDNTMSHIFEEPGLFNVLVQVQDSAGNTGQFTLEMPVKDTQRTQAVFTAELEDNTVTFENQSTAAFALADKILIYDWSFGDTDEAGFEAQKDQRGLENPVYTYKKAGTYFVTLTVTDADRVTDSETMEVVIEKDLKGEPKPPVFPDTPGQIETPSDSSGGGGSLVMTLLKVALYLVLIVAALALLILGGFLAFLKLQHPDLSFDELIDELKVKILTALGIDEAIDHVSAASPVPPPAAEKPEEPPKQTPASSPKPAAVPRSSEPPKAPQTHAGKEVIEGEVEEDAPASKPAPSVPPVSASRPPASAAGDPPAGSADFTSKGPADGSLNKKDGPVPDWLQGV